MEPLTAIYAILGGLSLVGADTYFSSSTVHFKTSVAPAYEQSGISADLVESILLAEFESIVDAKSLVAAPHLVSSKDQPVSSALAQAAGLSDALEAAKSAVGVNHPSLIVSLLVEKKGEKETSRVVVAGETEEGHGIRFSVPIDGRSLEDALEETAFKATYEINPYVAILHSLEVSAASSSPPWEAERLLREELDRSSRDEVDPRRAQLENLMGVVQLFLKGTPEGDYWFGKAMASDRSSVAPILNKAFGSLVANDCRGAIDLINTVVEPSYWAMTDDKSMLYAAHNILGICHSRLGEHEQSDEHFEEAAAERPDGTSVYYYWSTASKEQGNQEQADVLLALAKRNVSRMDDYPEIAMLHFWVPERGSQTLVKRSRSLPIVQAEAVSP